MAAAAVQIGGTVLHHFANRGWCCHADQRHQRCPCPCGVTGDRWTSLVMKPGWPETKFQPTAHHSPRSWETETSTALTNRW